MSPYRQRILFLGMSGQFSYIVLARLLAAKVGVVAIAVDGRGETDVPLQLLPPQAPVGQLPLTTPYLQPTIIQLGWQQQIPVWQVGDRGAVALATAVTGTRQKRPPAVGVVACFSQRLPEQLLSLPRHGFLNLHPSRLPHFRGPEPLFWTFRAGVQQTGVTLHWLDSGLDTGDIALQAELMLPLGISGPEAERQTAELCAQLLIAGLQQLAAGRLPRRPQPEGGSYQSLPTAADFEIPTSWPASRAFHFMRGTGHWQRPYTIVLANGEKMVAKTAVAYSEQGGEQTAVYPLAQPVSFNPGLLWVR